MNGTLLQAHEMAWSLHRVFAIHVALHDYERSSKLLEKEMVLERTAYPNEHRVLCPLALSPEAEHDEDIVSSEDVPRASLASSTSSTDSSQHQQEPPFKGPILLPM